MRARPPKDDPARRPAGAAQIAALEAVHGLRAGLAVFARRPEDIARAAYSPEVRREVADLVRWAASRGVACREAPAAELDRMAGAAHHEGLCVLAKPRRWAAASDLGASLCARGGWALALDRVRNPYNVGAMLRSAAFFGVDGVLLGAPAPHPGLPPTAVRVAEGGAEHVPIARTTDLADTLARWRAHGARVVGADVRAATEALGFPFVRPAVLVVGNEREGLADRVRAQCDALIAIDGSGAVESLNVAVAAGILLAEMARGAIPVEPPGRRG